MKDLLTEIDALIHLLDDPDETIYQGVSKRLYTIGRPAISSLEKAWNRFPSVIFQERVEFIIHNIHFQWIKNNLLQWLHSDSDNLFKGAYIVSTIQYTELEEDDLRAYFKELQKDLNFELNFDLTPLEKVRAFNHVFFEIHKFSGNYGNYYSPFNNFVNYVFEARKGNPFSLAIVYSVLAQQLGLPIYGVNLPHNFVLAWVDDYAKDNQDVIFYINPYNKGTILGKREIELFLKQQNIEPEEFHYLPCSNIDMIRRLIFNLLNAYEKSGNLQRFDELKILLDLFEKK